MNRLLFKQAQSSFNLSYINSRMINNKTKNFSNVKTNILHYYLTQFKVAVNHLSLALNKR